MGAKGTATTGPEGGQDLLARRGPDATPAAAPAGPREGGPGRGRGFPGGIQARIVVPLAAMVCLASAAIGIIGVRTVSRIVADRFREEMAAVARVLEPSGLSLSQASAWRVKEVLHADLAVVEADGTIPVTTLPPATIPALRRVQGNLHGGSEVVLGGQSYVVAYAGAPLPPGSSSAQRPSGSPLEPGDEDGSSAGLADRGAGPPRRLLLLYPAEVLVQAQARAAFPVVIVVLLASLGCAGVALLVGRGIARPIRRLADAAGRVARGDLDSPVEVTGPDEVGLLADAFRQMTRGLREYQERLVRTENVAMLGRLSAGLAHEVRNPLTSIRMTVQMFRRKAASAGLDPEPLDVVLEELQRLDLEIRKFLALARPEDRHLVEVDVAGIAREILRLLDRQLRHLGITCRLEADEGLPAVRADRDQVRQVVINLLLNAMAAVGRKGEIVVRTRAEGSPSTPAVVLEVEDTGGGVPAEVAPRIFEPFFTTRKDGTGLGLALARQVVERHGGTISFSNTERGALFRVELPAGAQVEEGTGRRRETGTDGGGAEATEREPGTPPPAPDPKEGGEGGQNPRRG